VSDADNTPEQALIAHACSVDYARLDDAVRRQVRDLIFDTVAVGIGAAVSDHASGRIVEQYALTRFGAGERAGATLWSGREHLPAEDCALVNGTYAEVLDYQDTVIHPRNAGHLAVTIVPAALAMAEEVDADTIALGSAVAAGIDVGVAILDAVGTKHREQGRGFRTTALSGPAGAAVACARLMGLDAEQTNMALGIAVSSAPKGLMASLASQSGEFAMDKDLQNGLSAQLGLVAAKLAARGLTASSRAISGPAGLIASHAENDARSLLPPGPGQSFARFLCLKAHPACYGVLASVEAVLQLQAEDLPTADHIDEVRIHIKDISATSLNVYKIPNHMAARFSLPYCVATALIAGKLDPEDFSDAALSDPATLAFMDKIEIVSSPELSRVYREEGLFAGEVEITAGDRTWKRRVMQPPGSFNNPLGPARLENKFKKLVAGKWNEAQQSAFIAAFTCFDEPIGARRLLQSVRDGNK